MFINAILTEVLEMLPVNLIRYLCSALLLVRVWGKPLIDRANGNHFPVSWQASNQWESLQPTVPYISCWPLCFCGYVCFTVALIGRLVDAASVFECVTYLSESIIFPSVPKSILFFVSYDCVYPSCVRVNLALLRRTWHISAVIMQGGLMSRMVVPVYKYMLK